MLQFFAHQRRIDPQPLRRVGGEFVPRNAVGQTPDMRQQIVECLVLALRRAPREQLLCPPDQVFGMPFAPCQSGHVSLHSPFADKSIGIETAFERHHFDFEVLFCQQGNRFLRCVGACCIGIEVDRHALGVPAQQVYLHRGKSCPAGGQYILHAGHVGANAVHLALDQYRKVQLPDRLPRLVQVEKYLALGIERRFRRIHVLWPGIFVRIERPRGEGNHSSGLVLYRKGDPLAKARIEPPGCSIRLLF